MQMHTLDSMYTSSSEYKMMDDTLELSWSQTNDTAALRYITGYTAKTVDAHAHARMPPCLIPRESVKFDYCDFYKHTPYEGRRSIYQQNGERGGEGTGRRQERRKVMRKETQAETIKRNTNSAVVSMHRFNTSSYQYSGRC